MKTLSKIIAGTCVLGALITGGAVVGDRIREGDFQESLKGKNTVQIEMLYKEHDNQYSKWRERAAGATVGAIVFLAGLSLLYPSRTEDEREKGKDRGPCGPGGYPR